MNQIEDSLNGIKIIDDPLNNIINSNKINGNDNNNSKDKNTKMDYSIFLPKQTKSKPSVLDWSAIIEDGIDDCCITISSSINYENDIFDLSRNVIITEKVIANALESEKTLHRIFSMNPQLYPNERYIIHIVMSNYIRNALISYNTMKEYQKKFKQEMMLLFNKAIHGYMIDDSSIM